MPAYNFEYNQTLELSIEIQAESLEQAVQIFHEKDQDGSLRGDADIFEEKPPVVTKVELYT